MRILYVTTIGGTMSFFVPFIKKLIGECHTVDIATNETDSKVPECYREWGCNIYNISCTRSPFNLGTIKAIGEIKKIVRENKYDIVHCHTPIAALCTRFACMNERKKGTKVFYTAHGFHFYKGAPLKNWLVYYPAELICSFFTDKLITINEEDHGLAKSKFYAKETCYVPGVGVDLSRFENVQINKVEKRQEIGVPEDAILLFSVGELNENKNHQIIVKALAKLDNPNIHYAIAGVGDKKDYLLNLAKELGVSEQLHLLGYRKDIPELNHCADIFCFPSKREGLSVSVMEAMASGLPVVCSRIRGNVDIIDEKGGAFFGPDNENECFKAISKVFASDVGVFGKYNIEKAKMFEVEKVCKIMEEVYK